MTPFSCGPTSDGGRFTHFFFAGNWPEKYGGLLRKRLTSFVEEVTLAGIREASSLRIDKPPGSPFKYHGINTDRGFRAGLTRGFPDFSQMNIEEYLPPFTCRYCDSGKETSMERRPRLNDCERGLRPRRKTLIPDCGHVPPSTSGPGKGAGGNDPVYLIAHH